MKKILPFVVLFCCFNGSLFAAEEENLDFKPFHPTDALLIGGNGPFNQGAEYQEPVPEVKPFHPTDALLIGGNGQFNQGAEYQEAK